MRIIHASVALRLALSLVAPAATLTLAAPAAMADPAADKKLARDLAEQGDDALDQKDYGRALDLFGRAYQLVPAATIAVGIARADVGLGRLVAAHERYQAIVREGVPAGANDALRKAVADAGAELTALKPRIPALIVRVRGVTDAKLTLDGEGYPDAAVGIRRSIDPGKHVVRAMRDGAKPAERRFEVIEGGTAEVELELALELRADLPAPMAQKPAPTKPPPSSSFAFWSPTRIAGFGVAGIGAASLIGSAVSGGLYWRARSTVDSNCRGTACSPKGLEAASSAKTLGLVNTVTFFGGLAASGVGVVLIVVGKPAAKNSDSKASDSALNVGVSPTGLTIGGAW